MQHARGVMLAANAHNAGMVGHLVRFLQHPFGCVHGEELGIRVFQTCATYTVKCEQGRMKRGMNASKM